VSVEREVSYQPPFSGLLPGRYDVFVFGDKIRYGLTGGEVEPEELKGIREKIAKIEEFYPHKKIVAAAKEGPVVRCLMELTRTEESYDKGFMYARWELWTFEPTQESWDIRKRLFLHRLRAPKLPEFEYVADGGLKGVSENAEIK
jgi:hypothetical protein